MHSPYFLPQLQQDFTFFSPGRGCIFFYTHGMKQWSTLELKFSAVMHLTLASFTIFMKDLKAMRKEPCVYLKEFSDRERAIGRL